MKTVKFGGYDLDLKVADDCVVIAGNFCPRIMKFNELIAEVKASGKTKLVIVGECHESDHHIPVYGEDVMEKLAAAGIECKWLAGESDRVHYVMPSFCETGINTFAEAENFGKIRSLLCKMSSKVAEVRNRVIVESKLLAEYPVVAQVQAIESHDHNAEWKAGPGMKSFNALFGDTRPHKLISTVNAVALFNLVNNTGLIVTKSQQIKFSIVRPDHFELDVFQGTSEKEFDRKGYTREGCGSIRVNVGEGSTELSIYCNPGMWTMKSHPEIDITDPDLYYVPMWKRVEKVK